MPAEELAAAIGYAFVRPELLEEALTHPSVLADGRRDGRRRAPKRRAYERLEFLGDRVLGLVVADLLWRRFDSEPEGDLTRRHAHLVRRETLARVAEAIGLAPHLILSRAEAASGAATHPGILADVCEALIGAVYLDGGFAAAFAFVRRWWEPLLLEMTGPPRDPKTALQEWAQARGLRPDYALVATSGPDHARRFTVAASVAGGDPATATASSKRAAEIQAAALLLDRLVGNRESGG
ncbi:MAG TPA: ribonuclease III [Stellaceae bacterium]|nr:ribonuclease III [Stellaceae bacterium]